MAPSLIDSPAPINGIKAKTELKSSASPLAIVPEFDSSTASADDLVDALKVAGGVVVRGLLRQEELDQIERDVRPWLEQDTPWDGTREYTLPEAARMKLMRSR